MGMTTAIGGTTSTLPFVFAAPGYRIRRQVGSDSLGLWFDAEQESLGRKVTLRVLKPQLEGNDQARILFVAEANRLVGLVHPSLLCALDVIRGDPMVIVTERTGANYLEQQLKGRPLGARRSYLYARSIVAGLAHLAERGLALRSLAPTLIQILEGDRLRIVSLGNVISMDKLRRLKGRLAQDARYVAPEQVAGEHEPGAQTDAYHVGALLFHMLVGRPPFAGSDPIALARAHLRDVFPSLRRVQPFLDNEVHELVASCTRRDPAERPSLPEVSAKLDDLLAEKPDASPRRTRRRRRR